MSYTKQSVKYITSIGPKNFIPLKRGFRHVSYFAVVLAKRSRELLNSASKTTETSARFILAIRTNVQIPEPLYPTVLNNFYTHSLSHRIPARPSKWIGPTSTTGKRVEEGRASSHANCGNSTREYPPQDQSYWAINRRVETIACLPAYNPDHATRVRDWVTCDVYGFP